MWGMGGCRVPYRRAKVRRKTRRRLKHRRERDSSVSRTAGESRSHCERGPQMPSYGLRRLPGAGGFSC